MRSVYQTTSDVPIPIRRLHPPHRVIRRVDEWLLNGSAEQPRAVLPEPDFSKAPVVCTPDGLRSTSVLHAMRAGCGPRARSRPAAQPPSSASEQGGVEVAHDASRRDADRRRWQQAGEVAEPAVAGEREERRRLVEAAEALVAV